MTALGDGCSEAAAAMSDGDRTKLGSFTKPAKMLRNKTKTECVPQSADCVEVIPGATLDEVLNERLAAKTPIAVVLEGVSEKWQMNVLQVLATPTSVRVAMEGHGTVYPIGFLISQDQARQLATQIIEILGREWQ